MLCLGMVLMAGLWAQSNNELYAREDAGRGIYNTLNDSKNIDFSADDVQFWCGTGSNRSVVIVAWDDMDDPTALVWGVRWNGNDATALDLLDSIAAHDSRFTFNFEYSLISNVEYVENGDTLSSPTNYWCFHYNGSFGLYTYDNQAVDSGDVIEMSGTCSFDMTSATAAIDPNHTEPIVPDTNSIAADDILTWYGSGESEVVIAVNWVDSCLAWGVRFNDSITLQAAMDSIACADYRFSYVPGSWGISDILYHDYAGTNMALAVLSEGYNYWWCNLNGSSSQMGYDAQMLFDGDFVKWGDASIGIVIDTAWGYPSEMAWNTTITPIDVIVAGPFCGAAGSEGASAVSYTDSRIKGWAATCTLELGPSDITNPSSSTVSYGTANDAVGPVTGNNLEVVSLGDGGMATLTFEHPIANGEGFDFAIFENSFNDNFLELAFVEVSTDGERFVRFPATSLTATCDVLGEYGSVDPTFIDNLAGKYRSGFGTPFDLAQLSDSTGIDLDSIMYVRVVDVIGTNDPAYATYDQYGNMVMDPYPTIGNSCGFDLDGVAVLNWKNSQPVGIDNALAGKVQLFPNPANNVVMCTVEGNGQHVAAIYSTNGQLMLQQTFNGRQVSLGTADMADGMYILRIDGQAQRLVVKH